MRDLTYVLAGVLAAAALAPAAEIRMRYSDGNYNSRFYWIQYAHPGTLFTPEAGQYPVLLKTAHLGFASANDEVRLKVWSATGSTPASVLASSYFVTSAWPAWTDVDLTEYNLLLPQGNFFLSSDTLWREFFSTFMGATPRQYPGHHFTSQDDASWREAYADWAIECTVETNFGIGVAPASFGRIKALYR